MSFFLDFTVTATFRLSLINRDQFWAYCRLVPRCSILLIRPAPHKSSSGNHPQPAAALVKSNRSKTTSACFSFCVLGICVAWHAVSTFRTFFANRTFRVWSFGSSQLSCCGMCMREILFFLRTKLLFWNFSPQLVAQTGAFAADGRPLTPIHATTYGLVLVATRKAASFRSLCPIITLSDLCLCLWVTWNF